LQNILKTSPSAIFLPPSAIYSKLNEINIKAHKSTSVVYPIALLFLVEIFYFLKKFDIFMFLEIWLAC